MRREYRSSIVVSSSRRAGIGKGSSINNSYNWRVTRIFSCRGNGVVPITVESVTRKVDGGQFRVGPFDRLGVFVLVQLGATFKASVRCCRGDQLHDGAVAAQWLAAPVDGYEREQPMLDLVPLAGTGRQVANRNG